MAISPQRVLFWFYGGVFGDGGPNNAISGSNIVVHLNA